MTNRATAGNPTMVGERANTAAAVGYALKRRLRALLGNVVTKLENDRDFEAALVRQAKEDPKAFLGWANGILPSDPVDGAGGGGNTLNIAALFLDAARGRVAGGPPVPALSVLDADVVDVEAEPVTDW